MIETRFDDWANTITKLGSISDKAMGVVFERSCPLPRQTLEAMYEQSALVARSVDLIASESFRTGWEISQVQGVSQSKVDEVLALYKECGVDQAIEQGVKWSRLYGGALVTLPVTDQQTFDKPLSKPTGLLHATSVAAPDAIPLTHDVGYGSPTFRKVLTYQLVNVGESGSQVVHHSRVIPFEPIQLPPKSSYMGWGPSIVGRMFAALSRYGASHAHAASMMYVCSILYLQLESFKKDHSTKEGRERIQALLAGLSATLSSTGIMAMDANDKIGSLQHSLAGVMDVLGKMRDDLGASVDMPREIMFNESPAGLNAGELSGPQEIWFAKVGAFQTTFLTPAVHRNLNVLFQFVGAKPKSYEITWLPLWTRSETSQSQITVANSNSDQIYYNIGAATAEEIREHRFVNGKTSPLEISPEAVAVPFDLENEVGAEVTAQAASAPVDLSGLITIVEKVAAGTIPYESAVGLIRLGYPNVNPESILGAPATLETDEAGPSSDPPPEDLMSPRDAASRLGFSTRTITRQIELGGLRYWGLGSHKRVSLAEVATLAKAYEGEPDVSPEA